MSQPNPDSNGRVEKIHVSELRFLCEQDGSPERELKSCLIQLFQDEGKIRKAYLARVAFDDSGTSAVVLCLCADSPSPTVVAKVDQIFGSMFGRGEHLDILFLSDEQEVELAKCCKPFHCADHSSQATD